VPSKPVKRRRRVKAGASKPSRKHTTHTSKARKVCKPKPRRRRRRRAPAPPVVLVPPPPEGGQLQVPKPGPTNPPPPTIPPAPLPTKFPLPPGGIVPSPIEKHSGAFTARHAERLLWRAGFGPRAGEAEELAAKGLDAAVLSLTRVQAPFALTGPEPRTDSGAPLRPGVDQGADQAYWLDRMLRSSHPLVERMALIFHDWFATDADIVQHWDLTFAQTNVFRQHALGSFHDLVVDITRDPAMMLFLDQNRNQKGAVNENYARELMELFTLGADRDAYTEDDVREVARALTGWVAPWRPETGFSGFYFDPDRHDAGSKTIFGQTGNFDWLDVCRLIVEHPLHASFFVQKLWSYFIPTPPTAAELSALCDAYVDSGHQILPVVEAILSSKAFYAGPSMVKPPVVYLAGLLRARGRYIDTYAWYFYTNLAGQRLYFPPDVAGWDESLWLNPDTMRARFAIAGQVMLGAIIPSATWASFPLESAEKAVDDALAFWSYKSITPESKQLLTDFAVSCDPLGTSRGSQAKRVNALRLLVPAFPDYQTC
jgi:hypothetical protein